MRNSKHLRGGVTDFEASIAWKFDILTTVIEIELVLNKPTM